MKSINPQFSTYDKRKKFATEESEDVRLYDKVKAKNEKSISLEDYLKNRQLKP
ncbi:hypothetical protein LEP1GSC058_0301 [Leptospira fainei serovar Hurstbridge str. BUT 6]|uniref:Uncharacterized protein n=1 Tax=Leptospira fainei serovar Hurstbridge str. BUT 6 TaxID=1193011 RepID=S3VI24_9LEPT|nr:hypothetical protein [Leptospira fainei]EPG76110.1 hypothetical protein LEP1GSC058_0301 [Leptospira fainei serovar Hurstbridge str. BUT 6]